MKQPAQQHLAIIDYPEGHLQQARWSVAAFLRAGFEVLLRRDGRCHVPARRRPYLGRRIEPPAGLARNPDWIWTVPAGALPTRSLMAGLQAHDPDGPIALRLAGGALRPGRSFWHASRAAASGQDDPQGWIVAGAGWNPGAIPAPTDRADEAFCEGLVDPLRYRPWQPIRAPTRWDFRPAIWETGRSVLSRWRAGRRLDALWQGFRGLPGVLSSRREDCARLGSMPCDGEFSVTYVLDRLVIAGGVLSVVQLVNELILLGVDARIACLFEDPAIHRWQPLLTRPMVFRNARELAAALPPTDLAVATLYKTAPWVVELARRERARATVYFLQDYEPWFFPERNQASRRRVTETYDSIPRRIVKSDWLAQKLQQHGCATTKIPLGLNLDVFHPRPVRPGDPTVLAMARPGTARRGFDRLVETLRILTERHPRLNIELFGSRTLPRLDLGERCRNQGIVDDPEVLAALYARADVFVDTSDFQGFGRCALEAMACGTACVLSAGGGVNEYAEHGVNALLVRSADAARFAAGVQRLLDDPGERQALAAEGLKTAARFSLELEAERTRDYFRSILALAPEEDR